MGIPIVDYYSEAKTLPESPISSRIWSAYHHAIDFISLSDAKNVFYSGRQDAALYVRRDA